jgi:hypothetical protein
MSEVPLYPWSILSQYHFVQEYDADYLIKNNDKYEVSEDTSGVMCRTRHIDLHIHCELPYPVTSDKLSMTWYEDRFNPLSLPWESGFSRQTSVTTDCQFQWGEWRGVATFEDVMLSQHEWCLEERIDRWERIPNTDVTQRHRDGHIFVDFKRFPNIKRDFAKSLSSIGSAVSGWKFSYEAGMPIVSR